MTQRFRVKFRLHGHERALVLLRGREAIREHAVRLIAERVAPAAPRRDGRQTPYGGHPVFVAQHATATCCRTSDMICRWIDRELSDDSA